MSHPERLCTTCLARNRRAVAAFVAGAPGGLEWYECAEHGPTDNNLEARRAGRVPIAEWFRRLPVEASP